MWIIIAVGIILIGAVISLLKDAKKKSNLLSFLKKQGFDISENLEIPDITQDLKPFCFILDRNDKKWFLANYRADYAEAFDYDNIQDYTITYRLNGNDITKGNEISGSFSEFQKVNTRILDMIDLQKRNCEHISFKLKYNGKAFDSKLCNKFVLFEKQMGKSDTRHDYMFPSNCFDNAKKFESLLFEILKEVK